MSKLTNEQITILARNLAEVILEAMKDDTETPQDKKEDVIRATEEE